MFGYPEFGVDHYDQGKRGFIDVAWTGRMGTQLLRKLLKAQAPVKIWLYYGTKRISDLLEKEVREKITIIHIPTSFPKTKQSNFQQSLF